MKLQHIELKDRKLSPTNVRKHDANAVVELVASIRSLGIIQPLLVRSNCEGFEVVAGQRRMLSAQAIQKEDGQFDPLPCIVLDTDDDAVALEASLAENTARLPMDEVDQYKAFAALKAKGRTVEEIAAQFGTTELTVKKRLAIANIITPVLKAYRDGEIRPETLRILTLSSKAQQKEWFKLFKDPEAEVPTGRWLKSWLFGGAEIPVTNALFPVEQYDGHIVSDLFSEDRVFDDPAKFHKLQLEAIIHQQAAYLEAGWTDVEIMEIGKTFSYYDKVERAKKDGGKVYISCRNNGAVEVHEGWLPEKEAKRLDKAKAKARGEDTEQQAAKPELTKAAIRYLDLHRHNAVRVEMLQHPQIALRLIAANALSTRGNWDVRIENQLTNGNEAIAASIEGSSAQKAMNDEREAVRALLGFKHKGGFLMRPSWEPVSLPGVFGHLLSLSDSDVLRILTFIMAETLEAGSPATEALGHILNVDMDKWWTPDDAFFDLLRDKPMINAMLAEVAGKRTATANITGTAKAQKDIIKAGLAGTHGRKKVTGWKPRYMRFPMTPYTKGRGLPAATRWKAVKKHFTTKS